MTWYVLANRRLEGPFDRAALLALWRSGELPAKSYLVKEEAVDDPRARYYHLADVVPEVAQSLQNQNREQSGTNPKSERPVSDSHIPALGTFSDEDLEKSVVSKIFTTQLDAVDVARSTMRPVRAEALSESRSVSFQPLGELANLRNSRGMGRASKIWIGIGGTVMVFGFVGLLFINSEPALISAKRAAADMAEKGQAATKEPERNSNRAPATADTKHHGSSRTHLRVPNLPEEPLSGIRAPLGPDPSSQAPQPVDPPEDNHAPGSHADANGNLGDEPAAVEADLGFDERMPGSLPGLQPGKKNRKPADLPPTEGVDEENLDEAAGEEGNDSGDYSR